MRSKLTQFLLTAALAAGAGLTACGGCDDTAGGNGAPDGTACTSDAECAGDCNVDGVCEGANSVANNTTPNSTANNTTVANNTTGVNSTTGNLPDGAQCTSDAQCEGTCNSDGICIGGGLPDGAACQTDEECSGYCEMGVCAGGATYVPPVNGSGQTLCGTEPCACDNGIDDDGDGLIDGLDPECTGAFDDDEGTFATGIPGDNKDPKWQDCFFDGNSGAGDDGCRYHTDCLTGDLPPDDADCSISQECFDYCRPRTPNGCDCFGCCGVLVNDSVEYVQIGGDCSVDNIDNCGSCVQNDSCLNECGECELCLGKTEADLPESCSSGGGYAGDPCVGDADCRGVCNGNNVCDGYGGGGYAGDGCQSDLDCRGTCGGDATCDGFGGGTGQPGDACTVDADCVGECGLDNSLCFGGGGFVGEPCTDDADCQGTCGGTNTCTGYGGGGYDGDPCIGDGDCRGSCGADNTCTGSGSGTGSGVQCDGGEVPCPGGQADCPSATATTSYYCLQGCCLRIEG